MNATSCPSAWKPCGPIVEVSLMAAGWPAVREFVRCHYSVSILTYRFQRSRYECYIGKREDEAVLGLRVHAHDLPLRNNSTDSVFATT